MRTTGPMRLDAEGIRCYVNPQDPNYPAVHFFSINPELRGSDFENDLYMYTVLMDDTERPNLFPTDCSSDGECSCNSIQSIRPNYRVDLNWCQQLGAKCRIQSTQRFTERICNVNAKYEVVQAGLEPKRICTLQAGFTRLFDPNAEQNVEPQIARTTTTTTGTDPQLDQQYSAGSSGVSAATRHTRVWGTEHMLLIMVCLLLSTLTSVFRVQ